MRYQQLREELLDRLAETYGIGDRKSLSRVLEEVEFFSPDDAWKEGDRGTDSLDTLAWALNRALVLLSDDVNWRRLVDADGTGEASGHLGDIQEAMADLRDLAFEAHVLPPGRGRPPTPPWLADVLERLADYWEKDLGRDFARGRRGGGAASDATRFCLAVIDFIDLAAKPGVNRAMEKIIEKRLALRGNGK